MTIAVDFDGTIVEHKYPEIGEELPFATETLKMLIKEIIALSFGAFARTSFLTMQSTGVANVV